jgi:hypothetical protein
MQKLMIATIGLSLTMGVAGAALATQPASSTAPAGSDATATMPAASDATTPTPTSSPAANLDPSGANTDTGMTAPTPNAAPQSYPRCSASVHDECRQRQ